MEYNTQRKKLRIPVYGRNIQKMIEQCITIEDREKRTKTAELIVSVMAEMIPKTKDSGDFKQKLWDHLHIISDFRLDVDSPYPPPARDVLSSKPEQVAYQDNNISMRPYGKNIERIIEKAIEYPEGEEKDVLVMTIANHLKKAYLNWNRNSVDDSLIIKHLEILSDGKLVLPEDTRLIKTNEVLSQNKKKKTQQPSNHKQKGKRK